jgi:hypothetical protein
MPGSKVDRSRYPDEPELGGKIAEAQKSTGVKDTSRLSTMAPQLVSLRDSARAATGTTETKPSLLGTLRERLGRRTAADGLDPVPEKTAEETSVQRERSTRVSSTIPEQQTELAKAAPRNLGANGSNEGGKAATVVPNPTSSPSKDDPVQVLLDHVTALESRAASLAGRLAEAAQELQSGNIPAESLASDLALFHVDLKALQRQTAERAQSLSVPAEAALATVEAFRGLRTVLAAIHDTEQRNAFRNLHARATHEIEAVLAIEPRLGIAFAPLDESKAAATRLLAEIAGAQFPDSHPECVVLVERRHAYSRLVDLVRDGERLDDSDWEAAEEAVAAAFGKRLATAAVRGRLHMKGGPVDPVQAVSHCPACKAELEPGARFCGDCGAKID